MRRTVLAGAIVLTVVAGCAPGSSAPSSSAGTSAPGATADVTGANLPPGCEPIDLRAPDGSPVDVEGEWIDESRTDAGTMHWFIRTAGNCFYAVGVAPSLTDYSDSFTVQTFTGTIQPDFTIDGAFVHLGPHNDAETTTEYVPASLRIEFAEDGIAIREDRVPNVPGPRCPRPEVCTPPLDLR